MKVEKSKISNFTLEQLKDSINKKIAGIVVPPASIFQPKRNTLVTSEITFTLFDATWGYLNIKYMYSSLGKSNGGVLLYIERNINLFEDAYQKHPPPTYGLNIEYDEFVIKKIEIYGFHYFMDKNDCLITDLSSKINKRDIAIEVDDDSLIIFSDSNDNEIIIKAEFGMLLIGFDSSFKNEFINKSYNTDNPRNENNVFLLRKYIVE